MEKFVRFVQSPITLPFWLWLEFLAVTVKYVFGLDEGVAGVVLDTIGWALIVSAFVTWVWRRKNKRPMQVTTMYYFTEYPLSKWNGENVQYINMNDIGVGQELTFDMPRGEKPKEEK